MENQQWPAKCQQSGAGTDTADSLDNGEKSDGKEEADSPTISEKAMQLISVILDQMKEMTNAEKYLLYLKLFQKSNVVDPLRQPLNPLGSRSEINRTISWIKTHLEEDPDTSLPKQQVYEEYSRYCFQNQIKSLSQADFGKVMKQVYPKVRARRLGTRGNSRYCYSGLRRCIKLKAPKLPDLADKPLSTEAPCTQSSLTAAAWLIVKEWSELHFGVQFPSLQALARFLVLNHSVGVGSEAANQLTSATEAQLKGENGKGGTKHREMQLQLQKKIQQKNEVKERKRKIQSPKCDPKPCKKSKSSRPETSPTLTVAGGESSTSTSTGSTSTSPTQGKPICDKSLDFTQLPSLPDFKSFQKPVCEQQQQNGGVIAAKVAIPRLAMKAQQQQRSPQSSPKKQAKNAKYKAIQPKPQPCDNASYNPQQPSTAAADIRSQGVNVDRFKERIKCSDDDCDAPVFPLSRERLESISNVDKDAMDEYLGTNNSQHEEELSKYFNDNIETADQDNTTKLSQLRQLLEQNGISDSKNFPPPPLIAAAPDVTLAAPALLDPLAAVPAMAPFVAAAPAPQTAAPHGRRRVSFETPLQDGGDAVPPSPNTRRKNFSFTPISPGPQSPNGGRQSSTNVSPFVSPRNTPVPRSKNTAHQNAGLGVARKKIKREQPELSVDIPKNYMAMSAPASPMLYSGGGGGGSKSMLEKLLHSNSKVPYTPDYAAPAKQDLSGEIGGLLENNDLADFTVGYHRSQSVPLKASFDFQPAGDFADFDPIPDAAEAVTVNRIIDSLEEQTYEAMAGFGLIDGFAAMPCRRSQSIDCYEPAAGAAEKVNPSRSVPSTPLPVRGQPGSRSYPSTPLLEAAFEYAAVNGDCLLNGQPIRAAASNGLAFFMQDLNEMGEAAPGAAEDEFGRSLAGNEFADIVENENGLMDENGVLIGEQSFAGN